jgi:hypothetical protein
MKSPESGGGAGEGGTTDLNTFLKRPDVGGVRKRIDDLERRLRASRLALLSG